MPAVAGRFYPSDPSELAKTLDLYLAPGSSDVVGATPGCMVPHAGFMYSGHVAGAVYRRLPACSTFVILGPNHSGRGSAPLAIMTAGAWRTPLGDAALHHELAESLLSGCAGLAEDAEAHRTEHSIEVQIPFLQRRLASFRFVPVAIGAVGYEALAGLGRGIARALQAFREPVMIIASSDMNHYEPDDLTRAKDAKAIERILALDPMGLYDTVRRENISMCGAGPAIAMLTAVRELGARHAILEKYATSADSGGDPSAVVGYAGVIVQ